MTSSKPAEIHFTQWQRVVSWLDIKLGIYLLTSLVGVAGCLYSWWEWGQVAQGELQTQQSSVATQAAVPRVIVSVTGGVTQPGVYEFTKGDRVATALERAGGLLPEVDQQKLSHSISLASLLSDGQSIYVPVAKSEGTQGDSRINLNSASTAELETLPGIGPAKAEEIVRLRPFTSITQLEEMKVLTASGVAAIIEKITL